MQFITDKDEIDRSLRTVETVTGTPGGTARGYVAITIDVNDDIDLSTNSCCKKHLMAHLLELLIRLNEWDAPPVRLD